MHAHVNTRGLLKTTVCSTNEGGWLLRCSNCQKWPPGTGPTSAEERRVIALKAWL